MSSDISSIKSGALQYSPEVYKEIQARQMARDTQLQQTGMLPIENLTPQQIMDYQQFYNNTLSNIDRLRNPVSFPSLQPPQNDEKSAQNEARTAAKELHRELIVG